MRRISKKRAKRKQYVDFNDISIPIGKRKVAYVKWLRQKMEREENDRQGNN